MVPNRAASVLQVSVRSGCVNHSTTRPRMKGQELKGLYPKPRGERRSGGLRALTHHRAVMCVRANHSEVFASCTLECRSIF